MPNVGPTCGLLQEIIKVRIRIMDYTKNSLSLGVHQGVSRAFNSSISEYVLGAQK